MAQVRAEGAQVRAGAPQKKCTRVCWRVWRSERPAGSPTSATPRVSRAARACRRALTGPSPRAQARRSPRRCVR